MTTPAREQLAAGLAKIGLVIRHQAWKSGTDTGLSPTQSQVLALLHARASGGGLMVSAIAAELALTPATVSDSVSALERKGLVSRVRDAHDRRAVRVSLTPEGVSHVRGAALWPDTLLSAIDTLGPDEQAAFVRGLVKMIYSLQQSGLVPVARMCPTCTYFRPHAHANSAAPHHCAYVDAPLAQADLRVDCADHDAASTESIPRLWDVFVNGTPPTKRARAGGFVPSGSGPDRITKES